MTTESTGTPQEEQSTVNQLCDRLTADNFQDWYRERQHRKNIENGTPYFNGSGHVPDPKRHSPSQLLQCHRKIVYRQCNAPAEKSDPDGIFWFGTQFEEDIVFPFLQRAVTGPDAYVCNTIWIDFTIETEVGELRIKGATDPVLVDSDANPILPTEIKTKSSLDNLKSPNRHHRAQLHAYLVGLSEKYELDLTEGTLIYGSRNCLSTKFFHLNFDSDFWNDIVVEWATDHTEYRLNEELPPADPEYEWECQFCEYRERCGAGESNNADHGSVGFVPIYKDYPRKKVIEHIEAHPCANLTPTLAQKYPDLAKEYGISPLECPQCSSIFDWGSVGDTDSVESQPICPTCADEGSLVDLRICTTDETKALDRGGSADLAGDDA